MARRGQYRIVCILLNYTRYMVGFLQLWCYGVHSRDADAKKLDEVFRCITSAYPQVSTHLLWYLLVVSSFTLCQECCMIYDQYGAKWR